MLALGTLVPGQTRPLPTPKSSARNKSIWTKTLKACDTAAWLINNSQQRLQLEPLTREVVGTAQIRLEVRRAKDCLLLTNSVSCLSFLKSVKRVPSLLSTAERGCTLLSHTHTSFLAPDSYLRGGHQEGDGRGQVSTGRTGEGGEGRDFKSTF